ncbi:hypothetical protein AVEN_106997-1 [Araneus ventricosus]|uniref:Uncharacterized protein n=1 Tax=Araneus ventricosus TaxID=182803 RepID=A0A4Y2TJJ0_ARAVE|nr:hypothetical protein AVEN_175559-1 [Araneus ventricosus]GBO00224.1 hypothetical protein AVEN_106997-1 [Araneus ventricosus]
MAPPHRPKMPTPDTTTSETRADIFATMLLRCPSKLRAVHFWPAKGNAGQIATVQCPRAALDPFEDCQSERRRGVGCMFGSYRGVPVNEAGQSELLTIG